MPLTRSRRLDVIVSSLALALAAEAASAQTVTRFTAFMHSGPGLEFAVTDEIPTQTRLAPDSCRAGWCRVMYGGAAGWIEQSTLIAGPSTAQPKPGERPVECMDFARTGWPDAGNLERVCIFAPVKPSETASRPAG